MKTIVRWVSKIVLGQILIGLFICQHFSGCVSTTERVSRELIEIEKVKSISDKYVKIHLQDGFLCVMNSWKIDESAKCITGTGKYYDFNRNLLNSGTLAVPFDKITILETNDKSTNPGVATMVVMGIITVPISLYCLANPKACFGSCPTFYVNGNNFEEKLVGEGFSSSICKAMEEKDVDLIDMPIVSGRPAEIVVRNEALETHLIRSVNLVAVDKPRGERVFESLNGIFYSVESIQAPLRAEYNFKSIQEKISVKDHDEWYSLADSLDLREKEDIFLEFKKPVTESALVIDKRQSLMTTFLFYHSLSITGLATGYYLTEIENGNDRLKKRLMKYFNLLGGIEVAIQDDNNRWKTVETVREGGPIVSDVHLVRLPNVNSSTLKIRLRMTKGLWRIDMVNLAGNIKEVIPQRIAPTSVYKGLNQDDVALSKLLNPEEYLVTYPGDEYTIHYSDFFEEGKEYFIESQGYYIEWMRDEWLQHQDLNLAKKMFINPSAYLKRIAPSFKAVEPEMEKVFWNSRYPNNYEK